jgi:N-acetylneuraminic acid mutarotase
MLPLQHSATASWKPSVPSWQQLPDLPDPLGVAGPFVGLFGHRLLVGGGANFPDGMPWEGGKKVWTDRLWCLDLSSGQWQMHHTMDQPSAYGVSIPWQGDWLWLGGCDADRHRSTAWRLDGQSLSRDWTWSSIARPVVGLPRPLAYAAACALGDAVYLMGGAEDPMATKASRELWRWRPEKPDSDWERLEDLPGPGVVLPVIASDNHGFFLFSGASLDADSRGKPIRTYQKEAYRYDVEKGWRSISPAPRPAVAAPSPALAIGDGAWEILGGDDGSLVGFHPPELHPGFSKQSLVYDHARDRWESGDPLPFSHVTTSLVQQGQRAIVVSGEIAPGRRTPNVWMREER